MAATGTFAPAAPPVPVDDRDKLYEVVDGKIVTEPREVPVDDSEVLYEVVDGKRVELPPMGVHETHLASDLFIALGPFIKSRQLGRAECEMVFVLDAETGLQRRPDLAFVSYERWPRAHPVPRTAAWQVVPNLAIEVVSPSNTMEEVLRKVREYLRAGVQRVWVVLPVEEQVYVYSSPTSIRVLERSGELDGEDVLPQFRLPLSELFEHVQAAEQAP
jgi:Uma2 family endonuclease